MVQWTLKPVTIILSYATRGICSWSSCNATLIANSSHCTVEGITWIEFVDCFIQELALACSNVCTWLWRPPETGRAAEVVDTPLRETHRESPWVASLLPTPVESPVLSSALPPPWVIGTPSQLVWLRSCGYTCPQWYVVCRPFPS